MFFGYSLVTLVLNLLRCIWMHLLRWRDPERSDRVEDACVLLAPGTPENDATTLPLQRMDERTMTIRLHHLPLDALDSPLDRFKRFAVQRRVKNSRRSRTVLCRGLATEVQQDVEGSTELLVSYEPVSARDRYLLGRYFLKQCIGEPLHMRHRFTFDVSTGPAVSSLIVMLAALSLYGAWPVHNRFEFAALAAACVPAAVARPNWVFYALVATFPFGDLRHEAHWALGAALAFSLAARYAQGLRSPKEPRAPLWRWVAGFLAANVLSNLLSPYPETVWADFGRLIAGCALLLFPIALVTRWAFVRAVPLVISGSVTLASVFAITGYLFGLEPFVEQIDVFRRATGGSSSPNTLALLIILCIPLLRID